MAYTFNNTLSQYLSTGSSNVTSMPLTMSCWFKVNSATRNQIILSIGNSNAANGSVGSYRLLITPSSTAALRASQIITGGSSVIADTANNTVLSNTWMHGTAVFTSITSRSVFLSNTTSVTNTTSLTAPVVNNFSIGYALIPSFTVYMSGSVADVGIWSVALEENEIASMQTGVSCTKIRPQSLVFSAPLIRDLVDTSRGLSITNTNSCTVTDHPRIYL